MGLEDVERRLQQCAAGCGGPPPRARCRPPSGRRPGSPGRAPAAGCRARCSRTAAAPRRAARRAAATCRTSYGLGGGLPGQDDAQVEWRTRLDDVRQGEPRIEDRVDQARRRADRSNPSRRRSTAGADPPRRAARAASGAWASAPARLIAVVVLPSPTPGLETAITDMSPSLCRCSTRWRSARYCSASRPAGATRLTRWLVHLLGRDGRRGAAARESASAADWTAADWTAAAGRGGRGLAGGRGWTAGRRWRRGATGRCDRWCAERAEPEQAGLAARARAGPARVPWRTCSSGHERSRTVRARSESGTRSRNRRPPGSELRVRDSHGRQAGHERGGHADQAPAQRSDPAAGVAATGVAPRDLRALPLPRRGRTPASR